MPTARASFESSTYWDKRFNSDPSTFEWLVPPSVLIAPFRRAISHHSGNLSFSNSSRPPQILHIGGGTSILSDLLRKYALSESILNVDFSTRAIELGIENEHRSFLNKSSHDPHVDGHEKRMRWAVADLLSWESIASACAENGPKYAVKMVEHDGFETLSHTETQKQVNHSPQAVKDDYSMSPQPVTEMFDIVIEKACSDAIACSEDQLIPLTFTITNHPFSSQGTNNGWENSPMVKVNPVVLEALHLAALTKRGGTWIALSYSASRFDCLWEEVEAEVGNVQVNENEGDTKVKYPNLAGEYWKIKEKEEIVIDEGGLQEVEPGRSVFRPMISYWLYVLGRTKLEFH